MSTPLAPTADRVGSILCVNAGSSSLKVARFEIAQTGDQTGDQAHQAASVLVEGVGRGSGRWSRRDATGAVTAARDEVIPDQAHALQLALDALGSVGHEPADAVGHRVVHGGRNLVEHVVLDAGVLAQLKAAVPFAPLHLPAEIEAIEVIAARWPSMPQVVCLDTAFHRALPTVARRLPLPAWVDAEGVRRYGFHGLSYEYVVERVGAGVLGRAIVAHLGSGASLAAIRDGRSIDTTMGFTPAGGVIMATRTGDLDPGALVFLAREHGLNPDALESLVNREAGLLGVSGHSADMVELQRLAPTDADAALAIDMFCTSAAKSVGALTTVLGGLDTIVFTGGIGENAADVRARICARVAHLGVVADESRNAASASVISTDASPVMVRVLATDENFVIARTVARLVR